MLFRSTSVAIGDASLIGYRTLFDVRTGLNIGKNVAIGAYVSFVDTDHDLGDPTRRAGRSSSAPITVGDGARISTGSIVLPGVRIGAGAVVGAGSLVREDCEPHALYVGRPARKVRDLPR
ncbi:acyltransferase [Klenkia sp. LSe6-5]|uniref:Acyltransferase n=1 Tax=Klenkia sesuvii TaxID=3103137 RepID=A0ABU8DVV5_9ACTN